MIQQGEDENVVKIQRGTKTYFLRIKDFSDSYIDTEQLLQVDTNALLEEIVTFPVIFNRIKFIKAEMDDLERRAKAELDVLEAEKAEHYRKSLVYDEETSTASGKTTMKRIKPTEKQIDHYTTIDSEVRAKRNEYFEVKKQAAIVDGLSWAAQSKNQKLDAFSLKMTPEDFAKELLEGEWNSVEIRAVKNLIN